MTKAQQKKFYENQIASAALMKQGGRQLIANATRLESEAKSALKVLGEPEGQPQKGKRQLSDDMKFNLRANLTK